MGGKIEDWLLNNNFSVVNDGSATRVNVGTGGKSAPDITLVHSSWLEKVEWSPTECMGSDHLPILVTIDCQIEALKVKRVMELRWNWKRADMVGFATKVDDTLRSLNENHSKSSLEVRASHLNRIILESAASSIGKVKASSNSKQWLTREIRDAIKKRNRLRRYIADKRVEWVEACREVHLLIRIGKEERWKEFLSDAEMSSDPSKIWDTIKLLSGRNSGCIKNEVLIHNGKHYSSSRAKADVFMASYAEISRLQIAKVDRRKKVIRKALGADSVAEESCKDFNLSELKAAIDSMKAKGAPGSDNISPRFLKALGSIALRYLLGIINESWSYGRCPASWREAVIVPLLKKGKPASKVDSFSPVSLTSCIAKTMERMVASRLSYLAESNGWWSEDQAGFRRMRSCEDQVLRLSQSISDAFQDRPASRTVMALLDFSKAYDTVWRERLLEILLDKGVPLLMTKWIKGFLSDRKARVRLDNTLGRNFKLHQGAPQGAVLSPLLFLFYIDGIRDVAPEGVKVSMYADDIAVWAQSRDKIAALSKVQEAIKKFGIWSEEHKLTLNPHKCEISFFSTDPKEAGWCPNARLNGVTLPVNRTPKFLGITYDRTLTFRPHVEDVKSKVLGRINILASLASKEWGWSRGSLRRIFLAMINSVLNYCGAAWQPWLAKTNVLILERVQNRALRVLTGQKSDTPLECLRLEAELPSFQTAIRRNCLIAWEKSARLPQENPRRKLVSSTTPHRWKNRNCFSDMSKDECTKLGLDEYPREELSINQLPGWKWIVHSPWSIRTTLIGSCKKTQGSNALLADSITTIGAAGEADYTIYTDGSAQGGISNGGSAAVITTGAASNPCRIHSSSCKGCRWTCSYDTEVAALILATELILRYAADSSVCVICSDSQSALIAIEGSGRKDGMLLDELRKNLARVKCSILLQWVPGHCGLIGNVWADEEAGKAANSTDQRTDGYQGISFRAARSRIIQEITDPPISHERTKAVYDGRRDRILLPRKEAVLLAQLRSGHCKRLAAYRSIISDSSPQCPFCEGEAETLEHWLQECPATVGKRIRGFRGAAPPLSVLVESPEAVLAFAHGLWSL